MSIGLSSSQKMFLEAAAVLIILYSIFRLVFEVVYFYQQLYLYFFDIATWVNLPLYIFAIAFVSVFGKECLCPLEGQWQVGIAAVFLVWAHLILYMRRMRVLGMLIIPRVDKREREECLTPLYIPACKSSFEVQSTPAYV